MTKKFKSKSFRVATEGATTDGRNIERSWIEQMAKNFDPKKYGARIWLEHLRGIHPESSFRAYGDVVAVESRKVEDNKLALFASIEPTDDLIAMNKARQKIYTSIEIDTNFAKTGEAYLIGLGVTDSPASLGTEVLSFAAKQPDASPFASRKQSKENLFSVAVETDLEFEEVDDSDGDREAFKTGILDKVKQMFGRKSRSDDARTGELTEAIELVVEEFSKQAKTTDASLAKLQKQYSDLEAQHKTTADDLKALRDTLDKTDANKHSKRPPATGGDGAEKTDC
ncbi:GPO family capsid scaffolding protein [Cupriavidus nantongensis]|nr:GPO family capsid scaffolding protein [Cupriavidus nantongensis]